MARKKNKDDTLFGKLQNDLESNNSLLNIILGVLIVIVLGILLFNYFNKPSGNLGPAQTEEFRVADVEKDSLPGKYTVKEGDTLYIIAMNYYGDGFKYAELVKVNNIQDPDYIETGQILEIPKLENIAQAVDIGTGGAVNQTAWGEKITGDVYTVQKGDWLSKIAGRAYGDIYQFDKIVKTNNIQNSDSIEEGAVLKIPR